MNTDERVNYQSYQKGKLMPCGGKKRGKKRKQTTKRDGSQSISF